MNETTVAETGKLQEHNIRPPELISGQKIALLKAAKNSVKSCFLATTALRQFWDASQPLLFLGSWCLPEGQTDLDAELVPSPWNDRSELLRATGYVYQVGDRLLPALGDALNHLHGTRHGQRYWRLVLGPWIECYVAMVYDRYRVLMAALDYCPDLTTTVLAEADWITPVDTLELVELNKQDPYNLQIFSRILKVMGFHFPDRSLAVRAAGQVPVSPATRTNSPARGRIEFLQKLISRFLTNNAIFYRSSYFPRSMQLGLMLKTAGAVRPAPGRPVSVQVSPVDKEFREKLGFLLHPQDDFERLLYRMIPMDFPLCFVEYFAALRKEVSERYPESPKAIMSANSWYYDEIFKLWAAAAAEGGTLLLGIQHGGNYGSILFREGTEHETAITDRFYSWGWEWQVGCGSMPVAKPASKLVSRKAVGPDNRKSKVLYISTIMPRYLCRFPYTCDNFSDYLTWQCRFATSVAPGLLPEMLVRLHREDQGWEIERRWRECVPEAKIMDWSKTLVQSIEDCRLIVCDNMQTTYLECLAANKPCILFWNPGHYELRGEAQPYYDELRSVGILHDTPESAAQTLNAVYDDVEAWWGDTNRQAVLSGFCDRFALTSRHALTDWAQELQRILKLGLFVKESVKCQNV